MKALFLQLEAQPIDGWSGVGQQLPTQPIQRHEAAAGPAPSSAVPSSWGAPAISQQVASASVAVSAVRQGGQGAGAGVAAGAGAGAGAGAASFLPSQPPVTGSAADGWGTAGEDTQPPTDAGGLEGSDPNAAPPSPAPGEPQQAQPHR